MSQSLPYTAVPEASALALASSFVQVGTHDADGYPDIRTMFALRHGPRAHDPVFTTLPSPFHTYLGTNTSSRKTGQIRCETRACLHYVDTAHFMGLTLRGRLIEVLDPAIRAAIWQDGWEMYYTGGRDGGDFSVFRFDPEEGRYYRGLEVRHFHV